MADTTAMRLDRANAVLVLIDVQERLMPVMHDRFAVEQNLERLIRGTHLLGIPAIVTEQYTRGLGPTIEPLRRALADGFGYQPIEKSCFSAHGCAPFVAQLAALDRRQILLAGVEAHVCVYQTATDLLRPCFEVHVIADAVSSRSAHNRDIALRRLVSENAKLSSTEMALFELLGRAESDEFRAISLVK